MIGTIRKVIKNLLNQGPYITYRKIKRRLTGEDSYDAESSEKTLKLNRTLVLPEKKAALTQVPSDKRMAWFVPEFSEGSGGHRTILRHLKYYEEQGLYADVYVFYDNLWGDTERTRKNILTHFEIDLKHACFFELKKGDVDLQVQREYSIAMATSWESAYMVANFSKCFKKVYFVQDFEPYFYAKGSFYYFAANTYAFNFDMAVTAGDWLKTLMEEEYKIPSVAFGFGYDEKIYWPAQKKKETTIKTVFYYARPVTERRGFELAVHILHTLMRKRKDVKVITAGWDLGDYTIPFAYQNCKKVSPSQLATLYQESDVALVISLTNLSLLPYEVAATGCPVLMNEGPNTEWIDPKKELFFYSKTTICDFVAALEYIIDHPAEVDKRRDLIRTHLETISWEKEIKKCYDALNSLISTN